MNLLYQTNGRLTESMAQSHICFEFYIKKELYGLKIRFKYSVQASTDRERNEMLFDKCAVDCYGEDLVLKHQSLANERKIALERITNMVTFSLEDENGFRGVAHRSGGLEATVCECSASPGFIKGTIPAGKLTAIISLHSLVADSDYQMTIYEMERFDE